MKKVIAGIVFFVVLAIGFPQVYADTIANNIKENTTWTKEGSPYRVGTIGIDPGVTLTVEPGVEIIGSTGSWIDVRGKLKVLGTEQDKVSIKDVIIKGISFDGMSIQIENAKLSRSDPGFLLTASEREVILKNNEFSRGQVFLREPKVDNVIEHNLFNSGAYLSLFDGPAKTLIKGNTFFNEEDYNPSIELMCSDPNCKSANTTITENNFFGFPSFFIEMDKGAGLTYDAANNYWSTTDSSLMNKRILDGARDDNKAVVNVNPIAYKPFNNGLPFGELEAPVVEEVSDADKMISGFTDADATVMVWKENTLIGEGQSASDGTFKINIPGQRAGTTLQVKAVDSFGRESSLAITTVIDKTAPDAPVVNKVNDQDEQVTGNAEPGVSIIVIINGSEKMETFTAGASGSFTVKIKPQPAGTRIEVQAIDIAGNKSDSTIMTVVDEHPPSSPEIKTEITDQTTVIQGTAEPGSKIMVLKQGVETQASQDGNFTLNLPEPFKAGTVLVIVAEDAAGNMSEPVVLTVKDVTAPGLNIDWARYVTEESKYVFGFAEPGAIIKIMQNGIEIGKGESGEDGTFAVQIPMQPPGTELVILASDAAGNENSLIVKVIDLPDPLPLTVDPITTQTTLITGKTEPNAFVNITISNVFYVVQANSSGYFQLKIEPLQTGVPVSILVNNDQGQWSKEIVVTVTWKAPSGWHKDSSGNQYYYDPVTGQMKKGWLQLGSKKYYFLSNGIMHKGWLTLSGKKYYFDSYGVMRTGWLTLSGKKYYFDSTGVMQTGWETISKKKYYFNSSGVMTKGWLTLSGKKYYFDSKGVMQTGWETISKKKYYFNSSGVMTKGWLTLSGKKYYFDSKGVMQTGKKKISGKWYYFNSKGVLYKK
ncbi:Ig-like domain-containing protein [Mesobacillus subterraneus]|uniref:Ig-like domain-containing protein n=1 Tax=Mesobacillus subterraneus TaxID=285983 RepID=UPI00147428D0|nr:Ig-like domain-containing protein [Mesobacillus subterraneus]